ncbi:MAG: VWA domain-containing protein [Pyrinomonadaceae bacterium]
MKRLISSLFLLVLFFHSGFAQDDSDVIRVNSDLVVLNVTVTSKNGGYVHNLRRQDFHVFEDDKSQAISTFSLEETSFAATLLLDTSGSMESRMSLARSAAARFLNGLREADTAAVYHFDSEVVQVQDFSTSHDLSDSIYGYGARGMTVLNDAILQAAKDLNTRAEKRRAIVILSDGEDTRSGASMEKALNAALAVGATIYAVDMTGADGSGPSLVAGRSASDRGSIALKAMTAKSGGRYIASPGGQSMREAFEQIIEELSNQYTVGYQPTNKLKDGKWRTIDVKMSDQTVTARTRRGYKAPKD